MLSAQLRLLERIRCCSGKSSSMTTICSSSSCSCTYVRPTLQVSKHPWRGLQGCALAGLSSKACRFSISVSVTGSRSGQRRQFQQPWLVLLTLYNKLRVQLLQDLLDLNERLCVTCGGWQCVCMCVHGILRQRPNVRVSPLQDAAVLVVGTTGPVPQLALGSKSGQR
jgi:hypothetical protein